MVCPHCRVAFKNEWADTNLDQDPEGHWEIRSTACTNCDRLIVMLRQFSIPPTGRTGTTAPATVSAMPELISERMIVPRVAARAPIPGTVPKPIVNDYDAAARVLPESAEASAALSRRCLQNLLVEKAQVKKKGSLRPDPRGHRRTHLADEPRRGSRRGARDRELRDAPDQEHEHG